jgi:hypothetical protein
MIRALKAESQNVCLSVLQRASLTSCFATLNFMRGLRRQLHLTYHFPLKVSEITKFVGGGWGNIHAYRNTNRLTDTEGRHLTYVQKD